MTVQAERQKTQVHNEAQTLSVYSFETEMGEENMYSKYLHMLINKLAIS